MDGSLVKWIVALAALLEIMIHLAEWRFLQGLPESIPPETGRFLSNPFVWRRSVCLARGKTAIRLGITSSLYALVLYVLFTPFLEKTGAWALAVMGSHAGAGVLMGALSALAAWCVVLPWSWARVFLVERDRPSTLGDARRFWYDQSLYLLLAATLSAGALGGAVFLSEAAGGFLGIYVALVFAEFLLVWLFPVFLLPVFFRVKDFPEGALKEKLLEIFRSAGLTPLKLQVVDTSQKPMPPNAMLSGLGRARRFLLVDSLLKSKSEEEVVAILAHEVGHWKKGHQTQRFFMAVFLQAVLVAVIWVLSGIGPRPVALLKGVFAAQALLVLVFQPFIIRKMQTQELEADAFAAGFAGAVAMKSALLGLASQNRGWAPSHLLYTLWYEAHPPVLKRLEALEEIGLSGK